MATVAPAWCTQRHLLVSCGAALCVDLCGLTALLTNAHHGLNPPLCDEVPALCHMRLAPTPLLRCIGVNNADYGCYAIVGLLLLLLLAVCPVGYPNRFNNVNKTQDTRQSYCQILEACLCATVDTLSIAPPNLTLRCVSPLGCSSYVSSRDTPICMPMTTVHQRGSSHELFMDKTQQRACACLLHPTDKPVYSGVCIKFRNSQPRRGVHAPQRANRAGRKQLQHGCLLWLRPPLQQAVLPPLVHLPDLVDACACIILHLGTGRAPGANHTCPLRACAA